ncbi:YqiA/YcfP family alpha/beta fold hydrolase [Pseudoalteromonas umbrosa]|uniref:YqiA/YcfP family alpha/beta fold hydrolase n=1 Tax=Pseudoalteromonas umbrosa TaxID=3048489 RepID=UPI0024C40B69|nr:YqiA/YcfP family alpha/beta fold hydrolase [Pseudoalteromonas sp. B95]MDK1289218.1 YqiA/YcfP family alpha/beta fold hydrolase [Pseudoalteromonas sp. B95]
MVSKVIYIHGFNSSEKSFKAQQLGEYFKDRCEYLVPRLHYDPRVAMLQLESMIDDECALVGSSLGGFFATYLSQTFNLRAVVVNPAVRPDKLLWDYLGPQYNPYQELNYELTIEHMSALQRMYIAKPSMPSNLLLLQQTADEVLPYQEAVNYYRDCPSIIEFGGDHSFVGFERHFSRIANYLKIK